MNKKKYNFIILSFFITGILLFNGCTDKLKQTDQETMLPSITRLDINFIQHDSMRWFQQHLNRSEGLLSNVGDNLSLTDNILTGYILASFTSLNSSFQNLLQQNLNNIVRIYEDHSKLFNLTTTSLLLNLLYQTPSSTSNPKLEHQLALQILSYEQSNHTFNTTPILSIDSAYALKTLINYGQKTGNYSIQKNTSKMVTNYQHILTSISSNDSIEQKEKNEKSLYYSPWFTDVFVLLLNKEDIINDSYQTITLINDRLVEKQESKDQLILGDYSDTINQSTDSFLYQLHAVKSMMMAYNSSITVEDIDNQKKYKESFILGLISIKNTLSSQKTSLRTSERLYLLPIIHQAISILPDGNWSFLWDSNTQTLIEGRTLQTSKELWLVLTLGVFASIGLIGLVFIIMRLYYKNKK